MLYTVWHLQLNLTIMSEEGPTASACLDESAELTFSTHLSVSCFQGGRAWWRTLHQDRCGKKIITGAAHRIVINSCHVFNFDVFFFIKVLFCGRTAVDVKELRLSFITPPSLFVHHESDWKIFSSLMKWNVCGHVVMLENFFFGYMLLFATHNVVTSSDP